MYTLGMVMDHLHAWKGSRRWRPGPYLMLMQRLNEMNEVDTAIIFTNNIPANCRRRANWRRRLQTGIIITGWRKRVIYDRIITAGRKKWRPAGRRKSDLFY